MARARVRRDEVVRQEVESLLAQDVSWTGALDWRVLDQVMLDVPAGSLIGRQIGGFEFRSLMVPVPRAGGTQPRWGADGRELHFVAPGGKLMAAAISMLQDGGVQVGTPVMLFQTRVAEPACSDRED